MNIALDMVRRGTKLAAGTNAQQQASPGSPAPTRQIPEPLGAGQLKRWKRLISPHFDIGLLEGGQDPALQPYGRAPPCCYDTVNPTQSGTLIQLSQGPWQTTLPITVTAPLGDSSRVPSHEHRVAAPNDADMTYVAFFLCCGSGSLEVGHLKWTQGAQLHLIGLIRYNRE